ncbi:hypothetical protein [Lactococcus cremoris]|nr:hypothetical protein [Lactococcus cremoris]WKC57281.1 hypothetical protein LLUC073_13935 [Lactococcus cremoris]
MNTNQFNQAMNTDIQAFIQNFAPAILGFSSSSGSLVVSFAHAS